MMNRPDEIDYYARRARSARQMADTASDATARRSHEEMAKRYDAMLDRMSMSQNAS